MIWRVYLNPNDYARWVRATYGLEAVAQRWMRRLPRQCAAEYAELVKLNMMRQKYMAGYRPYTARYAKWKTTNFPNPERFWILKGDLYRAIQVFEVTGRGAKYTASFMGGVPSDVQDTGGKSWFGTGNVGPSKSIAMYGVVMERGGTFGKAGYHPPRPIFGPSTREYERQGWYRRHDSVVNSLLQRWR